MFLYIICYSPSLSVQHSYTRKLLYICKAELSSGSDPVSRSNDSRNLTFLSLSGILAMVLMEFLTLLKMLPPQPVQSINRKTILKSAIAVHVEDRKGMLDLNLEKLTEQTKFSDDIFLRRKIGYGTALKIVYHLDSSLSLFMQHLTFFPLPLISFVGKYVTLPIKQSFTF